MRKKPVQARSGQTVDTIIDATVQVLHEEGENGLSTNRIAERAGFSIGTLYQYFPNKDSILRGLLNREIARFRADLKTALAGCSRDDEGQIARTLVHLLIRALKGRHRARRALLRRAAQMGLIDLQNQLVPEIAKEIFAELRWHERFPESLTPMRFHVLSRAVLGTVRLTVLEQPDMLDKPAFEDELVAMILGYLKAPAVTAAANEKAAKPASG